MKKVNDLSLYSLSNISGLLSISSSSFFVFLYSLIKCFKSSSIIPGLLLIIEILSVFLSPNLYLFSKFIEEHIEFKVVDVNKHRYDLEIKLYFNSITPPTIFENNGSQSDMYPNESRLRNFTYASNLYINILFK